MQLIRPAASDVCHFNRQNHWSVRAEEEELDVVFTDLRIEGGLEWQLG